MTTPDGVRVVGKRPKSALVIVDDVRVRVRYRVGRHPVLLCDVHGPFHDGGYCEHTPRALDALDDWKDTHEALDDDDT